MPIVHRQQQVGVQMLGLNLGRHVRGRVAMIDQGLLGAAVGGVAHVPRTRARAGHGDLVGQAGPAQVLADHDRGHRGATDIAGADKGQVHEDPPYPSH
jgi:hypothetical protein